MSYVASKRGDEFALALPALGPVVPAPAGPAPLHPMGWYAPSAAAPPPAKRITPRLFRFTATVLIPSTVEDVPIYTTPTLDVVDQWDGNAGRACAALEDILTRMLLRGASRRVRVQGGYIS